MSKGKVYFIGAGCGEYDLITLRGKKRLSECDAVVYDSLVDKRLLGMAAEGAELISVGKRGGKKSEKQENINAIITQKALDGKTVARLKGGDPFVFGRGGEEIQALAECGIEYEVIPGITSCVAVPELAGIPVTHRLISRGFHVITGHTAEDFLPENIALYAKENDTLVFLMGLHKISEIAAELIKNGKSNNTPAAVVSNGCTAKQRVVRGVLGNIAEKAAAEKLSSPAVIVIGKTAEFDFSRTIKHKLDGVTVSIAGTLGFCERVEDKLNELGSQTDILPLVSVKEYADELNRAASSVGYYDTIVFTSANGVRLFFLALKENHVDYRVLGKKKFAVVGEGTASVLSEYGFYADNIPNEFNAESLAKALVNDADVGRIMIVRAEKGSEKLNEILAQNKADFSDIKIYDTVSVKTEGRTVDEDFLIFGSSSAAESFFENGFSASENTKIIAMGNRTAKTLSAYGIDNINTPLRSDIDGIAELISKLKGE